MVVMRLVACLDGTWAGRVVSPPYSLVTSLVERRKETAQAPLLSFCIEWSLSQHDQWRWIGNDKQRI
eukprot:8385498-Ditylum_brightwellii.AAC.1